LITATSHQREKKKIGDTPRTTTGELCESQTTKVRAASKRVGERRETYRPTKRQEVGKAGRKGSDCGKRPTEGGVEGSKIRESTEGRTRPSAQHL